MSSRIPIAAVAALLLTLSAACAEGDHAAAPVTPTATPSVPATAAPVTVAPAATEPPTSPPAPPEPKLGTEQTTNLGDVTVYAVKFPVKAQDSTATAIRDKGMQFAIADIKVCANGEVDADGYGFSASDFLLIDEDARAYEFWNVQVGARSPNLTDSVGFGTETPRKRSCKRGWLTFQVPPKSEIVAVEYSPSGGTAPLAWKIH